MFAVIFEVQPKPPKWDDYLALAASLKPALETMDGFIEVERFTSKQVEGRLLSLSIWRDERAVSGWRTHGGHRAVQAIGRSEIFQDYRLRVGEIVGLAGLRDAGNIVTIDDAPPPDGWAGEADRHAFESIYNPGKCLALLSWGAAAAIASEAAARKAGPDRRFRHVRVLRDYGMFDRGEAPHYHPPVARARGPA